MECLRQNNKKNNIDFQTKQKMIIARKKEAGKGIFQIYLVTLLKKNDM